jgi:hypothetical protein
LTLLMRSLNPQTEQELFRQAYEWRQSPRRHRISFEDFAADSPSQITLGLFNGELQAVYFFHQTGPTEFQAHFTSRRGADRSLVLAGAITLVKWFQENNLEMVVYIDKRNKPLCRFAEEAGFLPVFVSENTARQNDTDAPIVPVTTQLWVEYRSQVNPSGSFEQKTDDTGHDG